MIAYFANYNDDKYNYDDENSVPNDVIIHKIRFTIILIKFSENIEIYSQIF